MELHPVDIVIYIINITILFILLRIILWRPVNRFLTARADRIKAELENAERTRLDAEALGDEYTKKIGEIEAQGREILRESQMKAAGDAEEIIADARKKAERLLSDAHERIAGEQERAVINARQEIAQLATDMAARILKREVSPDDNKSAALDFFREEK